MDASQPTTKYQYKCIECHRIYELDTGREPFDCSSCKIGVATYQGYTFNNIFFEFLGDGHYFRGTDGNYYWYHNETGKWYLRGQNPPSEQETQSVLNDAAEAAEIFPNVSGANQGCNKELVNWGLKKESDRQFAIKYVKDAIAGGFRETAWKLIANWNTIYPGSRISINEAGLRPTDDPSLKIQETPPPAATAQIPQQIVKRFKHQNHQLTLFSSLGGFHLIYYPTGPQELVAGVPNDRVLVRIPKRGATPPESGIEVGRYWQKRGFQIPMVYNHLTLPDDGFYIVEKVPNPFDPRNPKHLKQVVEILRIMSDCGEGPDFRPDNVRFRDDGQMVLIDFSENPGVQDAGEADFISLMKEFINQFAGGDNRLFDLLCRDMKPGFRDKLKEAVERYLH